MGGTCVGEHYDETVQGACKLENTWRGFGRGNNWDTWELMISREYFGEPSAVPSCEEKVQLKVGYEVGYGVGCEGLRPPRRSRDSHYLTSPAVTGSVTDTL